MNRVDFPCPKQHPQKKIVSVPIQNGDFPIFHSYVSLPEGTSWHHHSVSPPKKTWVYQQNGRFPQPRPSAKSALGATPLEVTDVSQQGENLEKCGQIMKSSYKF